MLTERMPLAKEQKLDYYVIQNRQDHRSKRRRTKEGGMKVSCVHSLATTDRERETLWGERPARHADERTHEHRRHQSVCSDDTCCRPSVSVSLGGAAL